MSGNHREGEEDRLIAIVEDINDVVIKEEQIKESNKLVQQMSKMDALARFAGGISHDYKNLLTAIVGNLDLLLVNSDQTIEQHKEDIYKIKEICYQGAEFVKQLVRFSQNETGSIGIIELNSFLKTKASFYRTLLGEHIKLTFEETTEKLPILIDISDIDQILLNLIVNAKDAMKDGGKLQIMTKRCSSISDDIYASTILSGSTEHLHAQYYVHIEVEDNGKGIDANSLDQIFEPYFSMKENGSGLGLSIVFSVVKKYGGTITVKSDLGIGTKFVIHLPMAENRDDMNLLVERQLKSEEMELDLGEFKNLKNKMILVIEDDERITSVLSKAFDKMKLTYFITKNEEEIHALGNILSEVSIIISDVLIEGGVGTDSVKDILLQNPTAEVLIISGYISRGDLGEMLALDNVSFLSKPFSIEEIIERIDLIAEKLN